MTVKYLIVTEYMREADLLARELLQKELIKRRDEWKWIPCDNRFIEKALGWYSYVKHDDVKVIGYYNKEDFLRRYEGRL